MAHNAQHRIAFVTSSDWPELYEDDHVAVEALTARGHVVDAVIWDNPAVDWDAYDIVVLRSTWDYYLRPAEFAEWIDAVEARGANLWNPADTLRWNLDKAYLGELERAGVPITPTVFAQVGEKLADIAASRGWADLVMKPRVSAAGHRTIRVSDGRFDDHQAELDDLVATTGALIQPFLPQIEHDGEWSLMFIDGVYSHAARKRPAEREFRVQFQYGGTTEPDVASPMLIAQAQRVVDAVSREWVYARVDGCVVDGILLLMELEMLEPSLFFLQDPSSADRFADAIERRFTPSSLAGNRPG